MIPVSSLVSVGGATAAAGSSILAAGAATISD